MKRTEPNTRPKERKRRSRAERQKLIGREKFFKVKVVEDIFEINDFIGKIEWTCNVVHRK
ncbi:hypothetical protein OROMI_029682 [Orobanche minor]